MAFYSNYRIRQLKLDGLFDYLYSPEDHDLPNGLSREDIRQYAKEHYTFKKTEHRYTPKGELKPNPDILLQIVKDLGACPNEVIYVGDSLMKDVSMAQDAKVIDVWAKYGYQIHKRKEYELLKRVTHWTDVDVKREQELHERTVTPTYTLESSFAELQAFFEFIPFIKSTEKLSIITELWKKTIDVQQHFNDLELRIRNFAITILVAALGAAGFALKEGLTITLYGLTISLAVFFLLAALVGWIGFYLMDRHWYHRLLLGAVKHGEFIENRLSWFLPEIRLSNSISKGSPTTFKFLNKERVIHSSRKIDYFYLGAIVLIFLPAILIAFSYTPPQKNRVTTNKSISAPSIKAGKRIVGKGLVKDSVSKTKKDRK